MNKIVKIILCFSFLLVGCKQEVNTTKELPKIEESVHNYFEYLNFNIDYVDELGPSQFWNLLKQNKIDITKQEDLQKTYGNYLNNQKSIAIEIYGKYDNQDCPRFEYLSKTEELLSDELTDSIKNALYYYYGIEQSHVKAAFSVSMVYDIYGDKKCERKHSLITFVNIDGKYYPINENYSLLINI